MEVGMVSAGGGVAVSTWLDAPKAVSAVVPTNLVVRGEGIVVEVEVHNPLTITLNVTEVRLVYEFAPLEGEEAAR